MPDISSRKGLKVGNWLQIVDKYKMEGLGLQKQEEGWLPEMRKLVLPGGFHSTTEKLSLPPASLLPLAEPQLETGWQVHLGSVAYRPPAATTTAKARS